MQPRVSENISTVKDPKWTGAVGETAILVSRGEPNRSNLQMEQAVADQARRYLAQFSQNHTDAPSDVVLALAVQLIATDYIKPPGIRTLRLTREHLLKYVEVAEKKLKEIGK